MLSAERYPTKKLKMQSETPEKKRASFIVLYHTPCSDGWCALAVAHLWFRDHGIYLDAENAPSVHANPVYIGVVAGKVEAAVAQLIDEYDSGAKVLAFDLAFTYAAAKMLVNYFPDSHIYDHHKTTLECWTQPAKESNEEFNATTKLFANQLHYDESISGAMLAWKYFYEDEPVPLLVELIQDRDLWAWKLPKSREINSGISESMGMIYPYEPLEGLSYEDQKARENIHWLDSWGKFMRNQPENWAESAHMAGSVIANVTKRKSRSLSRDGAGYFIDGARVYVCNTNDCISEIGEFYYNLNEEIEVSGKKVPRYFYDYVVIWRYDQQRNVCMVSMRARQNGNVDVAKIAQQFSYLDADGKEVRGGGHKAAAGFEIDLQGLFDWIGNDRIPRKEKSTPTVGPY